jgi:hypothetical protein
MPKIVLDVLQLPERLKRLEGLLDKLAPVPDSWSSEYVYSPDKELSCKHCDSYDALKASWEEALHWTNGLDCALIVMLASSMSTKIIGDQLWVRILAPASTGKSTLCEALSVSHNVIAKSTIRGFHSGFANGSDKDTSLIAKADGKTLIIKDGDTLLQSPNLGQILAEGRDIYDGTSRSHYRNAQGRDYSGVRMTWILCGTNSLRSLDQSELGERFLDCVIMDRIDDELEDEILWRVVNRTERNMSVESNGFAESQYDKQLVEAMCFTGGYVDYLRDNAVSLLRQVQVGSLARHQCTRLGKFVAIMRSRPSTQQDETSEREFAARLVSQLMRLAKCMAAVLNKDKVDSEVMAKVSKVAWDTAGGHTLDVVRTVHPESHGLEVRIIALRTNRSDSDTRKMLRFLKRIGAVDTNQTRANTKARTRQTSWVLTDRLRALYNEVS